MQDGLSGKRVLITGGTKGIGLATVLAFARAGATVVTCYRSDEDTAAELARKLKELGDGHRVVRADITTAEGAAELADAAREALGEVDVLVNNLGVDGVAPFAQLRFEEWQRVVDGNVTATYRVTHAVLPLLTEGASVVNVSASVALRGRANAVHYTTAKAALLGFTRSLSRDLGVQGIRVNAVCPGLTETEPGAGLPPQILERIVGLTALGRIGQPEDVAQAVLFLGSDAARYITGATLNVDGGL